MAGEEERHLKDAATMLSSRYSEETIRDLDLQYEWYAENAEEDVTERYLAAMEKTRLLLCQ